MKTRSVWMVGMVVASLSGMASTVSADLGTGIDDDLNLSTGDLDDPYYTLPKATVDMINTMGAEPCEFGLRILESQGWTVPTNRDKAGYEYDPLYGECKDFRDALTHRVWQGQKAPYAQYCDYSHGVQCVAIGHNACDFALMVGSGLVYICMGGITPYN